MKKGKLATLLILEIGTKLRKLGAIELSVSQNHKSSFEPLVVPKRQKDRLHIVFIDAAHFSVRHEKVIKKLATYVILGIRKDGKKKF